MNQPDKITKERHDFYTHFCEMLFLTAGLSPCSLKTGPFISQIKAFPGTGTGTSLQKIIL